MVVFSVAISVVVMVGEIMLVLLGPEDTIVGLKITCRASRKNREVLPLEHTMHVSLDDFKLFQQETTFGVNDIYPSLTTRVRLRQRGYFDLFRPYLW